MLFTDKSMVVNLQKFMIWEMNDSQFYKTEECKMSEMKEKLHTGELYLPGDEDILKEQME